MSGTRESISRDRKVRIVHNYQVRKSNLSYEHGRQSHDTVQAHSSYSQHILSSGFQIFLRHASSKQSSQKSLIHLVFGLMQTSLYSLKASKYHDIHLSDSSQRLHKSKQCVSFQPARTLTAVEPSQISWYFSLPSSLHFSVFLQLLLSLPLYYSFPSPFRFSSRFKPLPCQF